ncbi:uncharacterized protein LOC120999346 [Bufo bufo]|uniref:uncharacterized protein LOC120999346 n=1 Tax=Bufo bufo TaxID=8384 RepID=UPI001ABDC0A8|nr:uncharacterized protein LOC120999346 [Bufo bufo]
MAIINVEKLIILVQERPLLWDTRSELYHDRVRKDAAWEELTKELHPEEWEKASKVQRKNMVKIAKTRWNSTRDQFRRELSETSRSGDGGAKKRPYIYTKQLRFLRDIMELRPTVDNLEEQTGSIDSDETQMETQKSPDDATTNPPEMSQQIQTSSGPEETPAEIHPAPRRRSRNPPVQAPTDNRAVIDSRVLDNLNRNQSESPEELMLRSLSPFLSLKIAKTRWNSTRDQFRRELSETSRSGDGGAKKRPYIYTKQLRFLRDIMELRPTVDNLEEQTGSIDSDETQMETQKSPDDATTNPPEMSQQIQTSSGPEETPAEIHPAPRRRSRNPPVQAPTDNCAVIDSRVLDYLNRNQSESPEELMLRSLSPFLSCVPEVRRPVFMSTMNTILDIFSWPQDPTELT